MTWLVTGGAGFIGAHVVHAMLAAGERVVVLDDLSTGIAARIPGVPFVEGSVHDTSLVAEALSTHGITGVVHLAAKKQPGESVDKPILYYRENVGGLATLLDTVVAAGIDTFVFSSSASVYGNPDQEIVTEDLRCQPESPYGETKLAGEWLIADTARVTGLRYVNLRYFNVAGAARPELSDTGAFNVIPMVFERLTDGKPPLIFGDDYPTPDGTCIRDYVHVSDIASAHVAAAQQLASGSETRLTLNVGTGRGVSVREMVDTIVEVTGYTDLPATVVDRRQGDPVVSIASADRIRAEFGWTAQHDLRDMVETAWAGWVLRHPEARRG